MPVIPTRFRSLWTCAIAGCLASPVGTSADEAVAAYVPTNDPVITYLDQIDRVEAEFNAYSTELTDLYLGLGQTLAGKGEFGKAREAFQQGVQIIRVNFGLNSPDQTDYLFAIADVDTRLGNWKSADEILQDIYLINTKYHGAMDPGMLPVLNKMLDWYLVNRPIEAEANRYADLERSSIIAKRMADIVELDKGLAHADTVAINRKMAQIHWFTVKYLVERGISVEPGIVIATGSPAQNPNTRNVSVKSHIAAGREAFSKIAEAVGQDENRSPVEYAEALAQLGDWNLAFGKKQTAGNSYKEAWAVLNEGQDSTDFADAYFAQPVPVRFMQDELVTLLDEQPDQNEVYVDVSLTVTEGGRPLDVEFINPPEFFKGDYVRRVKRDLSNMRFRPRLENGEPAKTQDFAWQLPLTDTGNQP